jgi:hypothetical protein
MYVATCWGLLTIAVALALATLGLSPEYIGLRPQLLEAAAVCGVVSGLLFLWPLLYRENRASLLRHNPLTRIRQTVEPQHLIIVGVIGAALFGVVAASGIVWQQIRGPLFGTNALLWSVAPPPDREGAPLAWNKMPALGLQRQSTGSIQIRSIGIIGQNIGSEEVQLNDAYIVSGVTGIRIDLKIAADSRLVPLQEVNPIPHLPPSNCPQMN